MEASRVLHPSAEALKAFARGQLDDGAAAAMLGHLDGCPACRKEVAAATGDGTQIPTPPPTDATRRPPPPTGPTTPFQVPPELADNPDYEVLRELGRGGMGVVYQARHRLSGRVEVLKVMNKALIGQPESRERFLREIQSAARLDHKNVVKMHTALERGELMVLVMEYVEGEDLAHAVKVGGPLAVLNACYYVQQAAAGLQHAFEKGMVHRDIKPQNLMLIREGKKHSVKILDFGLAKATRGEDVDEGLTGQGAMMGTPGYVAPEQSLDAAAADIRADIYSLGCTLYYLLAGRPPFSGKSLYKILQAHQSEEAQPLNLVRPEVPEELAAVVRKMMAKDPARRYQTPIEVVRALDPFVKGGMKPLPPTPVPARAGQRGAAPPVPETITQGSATFARARSKAAPVATPPAQLAADDDDTAHTDEGERGQTALTRYWLLALLLGTGGLLGMVVAVIGIVLFFKKSDAPAVVQNPAISDSRVGQRLVGSDPNKEEIPPQMGGRPPTPIVQGGNPQRVPGEPDPPAFRPKPLTKPDDPIRRPPSIKNIDEAAVQVTRVRVETFLFDANFERVMVFSDPANKPPNAVNPFGEKTFADLFRGIQAPKRRPMGAGGAAGPPPPPNPGADLDPALPMPMGPLDRPRAGGFADTLEKPDYPVRFVKLAEVAPGSAPLARQLQPARMAVIAASFPYKAQIDEFKDKLRLPSVEAVLDDTVQEGANRLPAFRFLGVRVQRRELNADGEAVGDWNDLNIADVHKTWMMQSGMLFEPDDPRYEAITFPGLVMPRLREFHDTGPRNQAAGRAPGMPAAPPPDEVRESAYADIEGQLRGIRSALEKLGAGAPPGKVPEQGFDPFNPRVPGGVEAGRKGGDKAGSPRGATVPEHCLVRLVDVTIEPGKFYKYRLKVRMANPNYNRAEAASPANKVSKELESANWFELPQTVRVPAELFCYVVDQKPLDKSKYPSRSPMFAMWIEPANRDRKVAFQFHRWVESTPMSPTGTPVPVGDWVVADRVFVARGEYIGRKVRVDVPVWKYTKDSFVLPIQDQRMRGKTRTPTGVRVNFGPEDPDGDTILVDFEGGRQSIDQTILTGEGTAKTIRASETSAVEVLMLTADGKLLARNSAADTADEDRVRRREMYHQRIGEIAEGVGAANEGDNPFGLNKCGPGFDK